MYGKEYIEWLDLNDPRIFDRIWVAQDGSMCSIAEMFGIMERNQDAELHAAVSGYVQ